MPENPRAAALAAHRERLSRIDRAYERDELSTSEALDAMTRSCRTYEAALDAIEQRERGA